MRLGMTPPPPLSLGKRRSSLCSLKTRLPVSIRVHRFIHEPETSQRRLPKDHQAFYFSLDSARLKFNPLDCTSKIGNEVEVSNDSKFQNRIQRASHTRGRWWVSLMLENSRKQTCILAEQRKNTWEVVHRGEKEKKEKEEPLIIYANKGCVARNETRELDMRLRDYLAMIHAWHMRKREREREKEREI